MRLDTQFALLKAFRMYLWNHLKWSLMKLNVTFASTYEWPPKFEVDFWESIVFQCWCAVARLTGVFTCYLYQYIANTIITGLDNISWSLNPTLLDGRNEFNALPSDWFTALRSIYGLEQTDRRLCWPKSLTLRKNGHPLFSPQSRPLCGTFLKEKLAPLCQSRSIFHNGCSKAPFWPRLFSVCTPS